MGKPVKFIKCTKAQFLENVQEKTVPIQGLYIGDSGKIYFITDTQETSFDFSNNILYNNNIEENPFLKESQIQFSNENNEFKIWN